jgi:hypothetical protein
MATARGKRLSLGALGPPPKAVVLLEHYQGLGSGSVSRGLPLGEGPKLLARMTLAPRPKGGRGKLTRYRGPRGPGAERV